MKNIADAFVEHAERLGDSIALVDGDHTITYGELLARSRRAAAGIVAMPGHGAGVHVAIAMHRSVDAVSTLLGAWLAGCVVVPIDPDWPQKRRDLVIRDARAFACLEARPDADDASISPRTARAAILYTSGSTGEPKGVVLSHRALLARLDALASALPFAPDDVACLRTPPTFVDAFAELLGPLLAGIKSIVLPHPLGIDQLAAAITREGVTRLLLVPTLLSVLLDAHPKLASLRVVVSSGERLDVALARRFHQAAPQARLVNVYGSTEVAGDATLAIVDASERECPSISIGRPLPGVTVDVVGGELVIGGDVVADGYWNQPALTQERFVMRDRGLAFRTGDLGRVLDDGRFEVIGRIDQQAKIAGVRVDLVEVERALLAHPSVSKAAAFVRSSRLVASVVGTASEPELRAHLGTLLHRASVPTRIEVLRDLPVNGHGKIDRRALSAPKSLADELARLFAELVDREDVGLDDTFESIGGDSLALVRLSVELDGRGHVLTAARMPIPLTARSLAEALEAPAREEPPAPAFLLDPDDAHVLDAAVPDREDAFPVTDYQLSMVLDSHANGNSVWTDFVGFSVEGPLDVDSFAQAWSEVIEEEPALRTSIRRKGLSRVLQIVHAKADFELRRLDLTGLGADAHRERLLAEEWRCMGRVFDLERAPLFDVTIVRGPAGQHDLFFTYHHALLDGESARIVLRRVFDRYDGRAAKPSGSSMRRLVERSNEIGPRAEKLARDLQSHVPHVEALASPELGGDAGWNLFHRALGLRGLFARFQTRLRERFRPDLRADHERVRMTPSAYAGGNIADETLSVLHGRAMTDWAARAGATVDAVWATTYALLLARDRGTNDVVFGVVVSGRDADNATSVGMFANCLPLRVTIDPNESVSVLATRVNASLRELQAIARTPLFGLARAAELDPRVFLETLFVSWRYASTGSRLTGGRSLTLCNTRLSLIVSQRDGTAHLGVASSRFHRAHRVRGHLTALSDAILVGGPELLVSTLIEKRLSNGEMTFAVESL